MNAINIIYPHKPHNVWCFTDESVGLREEPFVGVINAFIDHLVKDIPNAKEGFSLIFSENKFPDFNGYFTHRGKDDNSIGNWYQFVDITLRNLFGIW